MYSTLSYLRRHFKVSHEKQLNIFSCAEENCDRKFRSEQFLKLHVEEEHLGILPHPCTLCDKSFSRKYRLKDHMAVHTGEYRFKCAICEKGFNHMLKFNRHKTIHQKKKCEDCSKEFEKWSELVSHRRTAHQNTEFKCEICNRNFCTKVNLKIHAGVHKSNDEKNVHQCEYENCPKFYFHKKNLDSHIRSKHKGGKFPCTIDGCDRKLVTKQKLNQHIKWHETSKTKEPKIKKKQAKRKDAGILKISKASILSGVEIPGNIEKMLMNDQGDEIEVNIEMDVSTAIESGMEEDQVPKIEQPVGLNFIDPTVVIPNEVKKIWFQENKHLLIETK